MAQVVRAIFGRKSGKAIFLLCRVWEKKPLARVRIFAFLGGEEAASIITHANGRRSLEAHLFATYKKEKKLQRHLILKRPFQRLIGLHVRGNVVKKIVLYEHPHFFKRSKFLPLFLSFSFLSGLEAEGGGGGEGEGSGGGKRRRRNCINTEGGKRYLTSLRIKARFHKITLPAEKVFGCFRHQHTFFQNRKKNTDYRIGF